MLTLLQNELEQLGYKPYECIDNEFLQGFLSLDLDNIKFLFELGNQLSKEAYDNNFAILKNRKGITLIWDNISYHHYACKNQIEAFMLERGPSLPNDDYCETFSAFNFLENTESDDFEYIPQIYYECTEKFKKLWNYEKDS